jgi:hypothetical protein
MGNAGFLSGLAGVAGLFWHVWWFAGVLVVLAGIAACTVFFDWLLAFGQANAAEVAPDADREGDR